MCGICGIYHFHKERIVSKEHLTRMLGTIVHRGPDKDGHFIHKNVGLGIRRLRVIDLDTGDQPISDATRRFTIVFNGEVYNYLEIKKTLTEQGYHFQTKSDTEVILYAYIHWGLDFTNHLNGMFAIAIWDNLQKRLVLARDRIGIKPLFYYQDDEQFIFGSEIKTILTFPTIHREVNPHALCYHFLLNYIPENLTLFKNILQVPPGHIVIIRENAVQFDQYWKIRPFHQPTSKSFDEYQQEFTKLMHDSVRLRLLSDVPLGVFLSGGLDSSAIAAIASRESNSTIQTFSAGFQEKSFDESMYSQLVANHLHTRHHHVHIKPDVPGIIPQLVYHMEEPTADSSALAVYYLSQYTRQFVTVALSGDGADEIAAGYETYTADLIARWFTWLPQFVIRWLKFVGNNMPVTSEKYPLQMKFNRFIHGLHHSEAISHLSWRSIFQYDEIPSLLSPEFFRNETLQTIQQNFINLFQTYPDCDLVTKALFSDTTFYLPHDMLIKVDRMSMAHSLEVRLPFLDYRIVEFFFNLPSKYKLHRLFQKKYLLKKAMAPLLPATIVKRSKAGFNVPISDWFRTNMREYTADILYSKDTKAIPFINWEFAHKTLDDHLKRRADNGYKLWSVLIYIHWYKKFIQNDATI